MQITLNGKPYKLEKPVTVLELSQLLELEPTRFAVEHNGEIVPRTLYEQVTLDEGDQVEIVAFIGGG